VSQAASMGVNNGAFGDEQSTRGAGPLSVKLKAKVTMNMILVRPNPRHRTENDPVLEVHATDTNRLEEFGHGHFESSRCKKAVDVILCLEELGWENSVDLPMALLYPESRAAATICMTCTTLLMEMHPGQGVDQRSA
jgi:hypothetical protein